MVRSGAHTRCNAPWRPERLDLAEVVLVVHNRGSLMGSVQVRVVLRRGWSVGRVPTRVVVTVGQRGLYASHLRKHVLGRWQPLTVCGLLADSLRTAQPRFVLSLATPRWEDGQKR